MMPDKGEDRATIGRTKLQELLKECRAAQNDIDTARGEMGNSIAQATEEYHLNKKAFALIRKLDKMEPEKLRSFMDDFEAYFVMAGLLKRRESAPRFDDAETAAGAGDDEEAERDEKVRRLPRGAE